MKHTTLPVVLFLVAAASIARGQAPGQFTIQPPPPMISTTGSAEIHIKPDVADLSFEVEIRNADLALARKKQAAITTKLLAALRAAGIAEEDLRASQLTISPTYNERHDVETASVRFYSVSQSVSCTTHDVDKVPDLITAAISSGATTISPAVLRISDLRKYRDQARAQAIKAAKEKAVALTTELGTKVGKPYSISEYEPVNYGAYNSRMAANGIQTANFNGDADKAPGGESALPTFAPGMITVTANIQATFYLE